VAEVVPIQGANSSAKIRSPVWVVVLEITSAGSSAS
jgi:hypothetical protein